MPVQPAWRGAQLAQLDELFAAARRGEGRAALVTGPPGTGRSALLRAFAERAVGLGALVLGASASPAETDVPLGVVGQLLSGAGPDASPPASTAPHVLHEFLRERAASGPVVVLVDDAHHMDEPSARCLLYVCGRLAGARVLLVLSGRPAAPSPGGPMPLPLAELLRHPRCAPVPLTVLDEDEVAGFLAAPEGGAMDGATARRLAPGWHRFTGGNPRLLHGLLGDHRACEPVRPSRPLAGTAFRRAVTACLRGAAAPVASAARALAVLADAATLTLVARLLETPERTVAACLEELDATGLLDGGRLRNEGVRAAVLEELSAEEATGLHTAAALVLYENGAEPAAVARHLVAAGAGGRPPGAAWAVPLLAEAARQALATGGARQAAEFLRTAHRSGSGEGGEGGDQGPGLLTMLARAEWETDPAAVVRHLPALEREPAARWPDPEEEADAADAVEREGAEGLLLWHGRPAGADTAAAGYVYPYLRAGEEPHGHGPEDMDEHAESVLESIVFGHAPPVPVAAVLSALLHAGETGRAARWCALTAGAEGARAATPARRAVAVAVAAVVHARTGAYDSAARYAGRALTLLSPGAWGVAIGMPLSAAVLAETRRGAYEEAAARLRVPVPAAMFRTRAGLHYLLARGRYHLAVDRPRAALRDVHACRDLLARWRLEPRGALDWRTPATAALRALRGGEEAGADPIAELTAAERRVAALAAEGCTNRAIAARLYVTTSTVEQHLTRIYRKLRVKSRTDLAALVAAHPR
ncbi:LuxR family transcriptional regulator [Streptomyces sp. NPDC049837]|uniref:helix-turn-helix transcriptional regulator n=1 Tax=Streptomyces sp. NPDC049837 TaxID=3155277 RepID=UPI00342284F5